MNGRARIDAVLEPNAESLEEVMVVAYGTAKKGTYTGAASVVRQEAIKDMPTVSFEQALTGATALGEAGNEVSAQCKDILPKVCLSLGKDLAKDKDFDGAMAQFDKAAELAGKFNTPDIADEIKEVKSQVLTAQAAALVSAKDFAKVIEVCNTALATDPANGTASLFLGMALSNTGKASHRSIPAGNGER